MLRNYLISALRNFKNNIVYSIIYLIGLALGITSCLIIFLFVENELKFDRKHPDYEKIYRVTHLFKMPQSNDYTANTQSPMADGIRETMTGFEKVVKTYYTQSQNMIIDHETFQGNDIIFTEPEFFEFFGSEWIAGDRAAALRDVNSIILTEDFAQKYFHPDSVLGQSITLFDSIQFTITGLVKNPDKHTHLPYSALVSINSLTDEIFGFNFDQWRATLSGFFTYVKLNSEIAPEIFEDQFEILKEKYVRESDREMEYFYLQPLKNIHTDKKYTMDNPGYSTSKEFIIIISLVGLLILVIASINVVNLRTAHAMMRSVEVGIRKVSGAFRQDLIRQFVFENLILVILAVIISLLLSEVLLSSVNRLFDGTINLELYASSSLVLYVVLAIIVVTAMTGIYPSLILSSFKPTRVLYRTFQSKRENRFSLRNILIVFQFIISLALIMVTLTISHQLNYMLGKDMGFRKKEILNISLPDNEPVILNRLQYALEQKPYIQKISFSNGAPASNIRLGSFFSYPGAPEGERYQFDIKYVDTSYLDLFDLKILAGDWFSYQSINDTTPRIVVNEKLIKKMGISDPADAIGKSIIRGPENQEIIGVVNDFHVEALYNEVIPVVLMIQPEEYYMLSVHYKEGSEANLVDDLEGIWNEFFPNELFGYVFLEDFIESYYSREDVTGKLILWFAFIAILITCLGILGLVLFLTTKRIKEFGIRKVLGVTGHGIVSLVVKDFLIQIGIAFLIATPISWIFISRWMQNFHYQTTVKLWIFLLPLVVIIMTSMIPVIFTTLKAANTNPADCLRYE